MWFIIKVYIICYILAKILYLGKIWNLDQNAIGQPDSRIFKSIISLKQNDELPDFRMLVQTHGN